MGRNVTQYKAVCWAHTNMQCLTLYTLLVSGALPSTGRSARRKPPACVKKRILSALHCTKADALLFSVTEKQCLHSPASHKGAKTFVCSKTRQKGEGVGVISVSVLPGIFHLCVWGGITSVWNPLATHKGKAQKAPFCYIMSLNPPSSSEERANVRLAITIFCASVL